MTDFASLGLPERLVERLTEAGLTKPTPIQTQAIPAALEGRDIMGLAQTGTGKTAAFGLPLAQLMLSVGKKPAPKTARGLVLAPTRELAKQILDNLQQYIGKTHIKVGLVVGGASIGAQSNRLARGTDILVATPGRLMDLIDRKALTLAETQFLVLDEADQMLDLGFVHTLRKIAAMLPQPRQTLLFSATMPKLMDEIAASFLTNPQRIEVSPPGRAAEKIAQSVYFIDQAAKTSLLKDLCSKHTGELALVFARTKHGAERLMKSLKAEGFAADSIHGNKSQGQRNRALEAFRAGEVKILVATDVAARGIDIPDVRYVYNYDLPNVPENYVHRIGRTARAGASGKAVAFCAPAENGMLRTIQKVMGIAIPVAGGAPSFEETAAPKKSRNRRKSKGPGGKPRFDAKGDTHRGKSAGKPKSKRPAREEGEAASQRTQRSDKTAKPQQNAARKPKSNQQHWDDDFGVTGSDNAKPRGQKPKKPKGKFGKPEGKSGERRDGKPKGKPGKQGGKPGRKSGGKPQHKHAGKPSGATGNDRPRRKPNGGPKIAA